MVRIDDFLSSMDHVTLAGCQEEHLGKPRPFIHWFTLLASVFIHCLLEFKGFVMWVRSVTS